MPVAPFPFIDVAGPPHERGLDYGRQAAERVHKSEEIYVRAMEQRGFRWDEVKRLAREFVPAVADLNLHYLDEMEGIAAGAGVGLETVIVVNARSEIFNGRTSDARRAADAAMPTEGCTGALALGSATRDGRLIHGQNWDFNAECVESAVVLRVGHEDGTSLMTFVEAGGLARSGFNGAGIAVTANALKSDRDFNRGGVPLSIVRRRILEARTFAEAIGAVTSVERAIANNMMLSAAAGDEAIDLETIPGDIFPLWPDEAGLMVHANHFRSPVALTKIVDGHVAERMPGTLYRDRRVMRHLATRAGDLTIEDFKTAFSDDFGTPYAVCRPPCPSEEGIEASTVATVIFDTANGELHARPAPYDPETGYTVYHLRDGARDVAAQ